MFRPADIIIDSFIERLSKDYLDAFGPSRQAHLDTIVSVARMSLSRIARTNALYHNMDHAMICTLVGQDMIRGRMIRDGDVQSLDWVQFVSSLLAFTVGFVRGAIPGDSRKVAVIDDKGTTIDWPRGATNGRLWTYFTDRSKVFVRKYFADHPVLDVEVMTSQIEYSRYPPSREHDEISSYPGLLRAAHIIGAVADPDFMLKLKPILLEVNESGMAEQLGYGTVEEFKVGYPDLFWNQLHQLIVEGIRLLKFTGTGRIWLANMHAHLLTEEHRGRLEALASDQS